VAKTGLVPRKSEARRLIAQGGVEVDEEKQTDPAASLALAPGRLYRLRIGKRKCATLEYRPDRP
jgi:tyrosyl-tRNA synthetase